MGARRRVRNRRVRHRDERLRARCARQGRDQHGQFLPPSDDRRRVGRLSRGCADRGQPIGIGDADSSARNLAIITTRRAFRRTQIPRRSRLSNGGDWRLTIIHSCCTYDGADSKCQKNGKADRDHRISTQGSGAARCCRPRSRIGAIDHPLSTLTESEIKVRAAQAAGQRALLVRFSSNARNSRLVTIGTIAILLIVGYISLLHYFHVSEMPVERDLDLRSAVGPVPQIYIQPINIDVFNDAMQMRVTFAPIRISMGSG